MAYYQGKLGVCWWCYFNGALEADDWTRFVSDSRHIYSTCQRGDVLLTIPYAYGSPSATQRKALADVIRTTPGVEKITRHAFMTDSSLLMAINTAISWISQKPWQERSFTEPADGLSWPSTGTGLTVRQIASHLTERVPEAKLWNKIALLGKGSAA